MIEFIIVNYLVFLDIYLIGFVIYLSLELIGRGFAELDKVGAIKESIQWPLNLMVLIGTMLVYLKFRKENNGKPKK